MLSERVPKRDRCGRDIPEANEPYCWRPYVGNIATCLGDSVPEAPLTKPWQAGCRIVFAVNAACCAFIRFAQAVKEQVRRMAKEAGS